MDDTDEASRPGLARCRQRRRGTSRLQRIAELALVDARLGGGGRYTPNMWVPPIIGPVLIAAETQKQFGEIRAEIMRRRAMAPPRS